jgi:hypothetical protein
MANFLSEKQQYNKIIDPVNINLVNTVLSAKQGKFDQGVAAIDSALGELGRIDGMLLRDKDREYLANNVKSLLDVVNNSGKLDLSKSGVTRNIQSQIKSALDSTVINAVAQSSKVAKYDAEVSALKEKEKGSYSDINYNYGKYKAGYQDWIEGKTDTMGNLSYTPYKDIDKKVSDFILDLQAKKKDEKIQYRDNQGGIQEVTISGLSPNQLRQVAYGMLDVNDLKQIEINGYSNTGEYQDGEKISREVGELMDSRIESNSQSILEIEADLKKGGSTPAQKEQKEKEKEALNNQIANFKKNKPVLIANKIAAATYLEQESFLDKSVAKFAPLYTQSTEYKADDNFWKKRADMRAEAAQEIELAKFQYTKDKDRGLISGAGEFISGKVPTVGEENIDQEAEIDKTIKTLSDNLNASTNAYKSKIEDLANEGNSEAKVVLSEYQKNIKAGKDEEVAFQNAVLSKVSTNSGIAIINNKNYRAEIKDLAGKRDTYLIGRAEAIKKGTSEHINKTLNNQETFSAFFNNPNTKMLWVGKSGKEGAFSVKDVLINNGLMDRQGNKIGDITQAKTASVLKALQQSYYADDALSNNLKKDSVVKLARMFNENPDDVVTTYTTMSSQTTRGGISQEVTGNKIDYNTKTGQYLLKAKENKVYDTVSWSDNSLSGDDNTISKFIKGSDYKNSETYKSSIGKLFGKLPQNQSVGVVPTDKVNYQRLKSLSASEFVTNPQGAFNEANPMNIKLDSTGKNVIISQYSKNKEGTIVSASSTLDIETFNANMPDLAKKLNFDANQAHYTIDRVKKEDLISEKVKFFTEETREENLRWNAKVLLKNQPQFVPYLTNVDTKAFLGQGVVSTFGKDSEEFKVLNKAIDNSNDFTINGEVTQDVDNSYYLTLTMKNDNNETIYKKIVNNVADVDNYKTVIDNAPQVYYADMVKDIFQAQAKSKQSTGENSPYYTKLVKNLQ